MRSPQALFSSPFGASPRQQQGARSVTTPQRRISGQHGQDVASSSRSNLHYPGHEHGTPPDSSAIRPDNFPMANINADLPNDRNGRRVHMPSGLMRKYNSRPQFPRADEDTPSEMVPVLTLLTAHAHRQYHEGFFLLLNDLGNDGKHVPNRQWTEVYGMLVGSQLSMWKADELDDDEDRAKPSYINITDATYKSILELPSSNGNLQNIIVLSTTMKNRYLLQFSNRKDFNEWTAALRLASYENTALQEAYTGALLSAKGAKLNGIRSLLGETKTKREDWCSVRFGAGMQWRRVWYVLTPANLMKQKKERKEGYGMIAFYDNPKVVKKPPLATIVRLQVAHAVFPERAVLMNVSSLMKCEGQVKFSQDEGEKDTAIFLMPEQHPGIQGFETLIRFMLPLLDAYQLYGRPSRLNADKNDIRSLLFAMPTLPRVYYSDILDLVMLSALPESTSWSSRQWTTKIKELLARKLATGFKGLGSVAEVIDRSVNTPPSSEVANNRRSLMGGVNGTSEEFGAELGRLSLSQDESDSSGLVASRTTQPDRRAVSQPNGLNVIKTFTPQHGVTSPPIVTINGSPAGMPDQRNLTPQRAAPSRPAQAGDSLKHPPQKSTTGPRPMGGLHARSASEGQDPNNLIVTAGQGPLTPMLHEQNSNSGASLSSGLLSVDQAQGPSIFDPGFDGTNIPSHYSYAEYSEYMQAYLARGSDGPPPSDPEEIKQMVDSYRVANKPPVNQSITDNVAGGLPPHTGQQMPPQQMPPQQMPPQQMPPSLVPTSQVPTSQGPPSQIPPSQVPPQQMTRGQLQYSPAPYQGPGSDYNGGMPPHMQPNQNMTPPGPTTGQWAHSSPCLNRPPPGPMQYQRQRRPPFDQGYRSPQPPRELRRPGSNDNMRRNNYVGPPGPAFVDPRNRGGTPPASRAQGPYGAAMAAASAAASQNQFKAGTASQGGPYSVSHVGGPRAQAGNPYAGGATGTNPYGASSAHGRPLGGNSHAGSNPNFGSRPPHRPGNMGPGLPAQQGGMRKPAPGPYPSFTPGAQSSKKG